MGRIQVLNISEKEDNALKKALAVESADIPVIFINPNAKDNLDKIADFHVGEKITFLVFEDNEKCIDTAIMVAERTSNIKSTPYGLFRICVIIKKLNDWENNINEKIIKFQAQVDWIFVIPEENLVIPLMENVLDPSITEKFTLEENNDFRNSVCKAVILRLSESAKISATSLLQMQLYYPKKDFI